VVVEVEQQYTVQQTHQLLVEMEMDYNHQEVKVETVAGLVEVEVVLGIITLAFIQQVVMVL
jgi:hypothetical protein